MTSGIDKLYYNIMYIIINIYNYLLIILYGLLKSIWRSQFRG